MDSDVSDVFALDPTATMARIRNRSRAAEYKNAATVRSVKGASMKFTARVASKADADEIARLVNRAYRPSSHERGWTHEADLVEGERTTPDQVRSLFGTESCIVVQCQGEAIVACAHVQQVDKDACIGMLAAEPSLQQQGLGKRMLAEAESHAVAFFAVSRFKLSVLSCRGELIEFCERRGYVRTGSRRSYPASAGTGHPRMGGLEVETLTKEAPHG